MQKELTSETIKEILGKYPQNKENLIKALHELQESNIRNYISPEIMDECALYFRMTKAQVYGVVTYYSMFSLKPRGKYHICLCKSPVCTNQGSEINANHLAEKYNLKNSETTPDGLFSLETVECLGRCGKAPSGMINKTVYTELTPEKIDLMLTEIKNSEK